MDEVFTKGPEIFFIKINNKVDIDSKAIKLKVKINNWKLQNSLKESH